MAMMEIMASATRIMVTPRSPRLAGRSVRDLRTSDLRIRGDLMIGLQFSFMATAAAVICVGREAAEPSRLATLPNRHGYAY